MSSEAEPEAKGEAISALLAIAERTFDDERTRGAALSTKATTLAGFTGTILSIVAALGREIFKADVGSMGDPIIRVLFVVTVVALATALTLAIGGVLRPRPRLLVDSDQVVAFAQPPWIHMNAVDIEGKMLASLGIALQGERKLNDRKAELTDLAALALLTGLLAVAAQAFLFGVDELVY